MARQDPRQAIIEHLCEARVIVSDTPEPHTRGLRVQTGRGGCDAKPETIRFIKERSLPQRQLHFVIFENRQGQQWHYTCHVAQGEDGLWQMRGGAGGAGRGPRRASPWANLSGGGWPRRFFAGGYVEAGGQDITRISLHSRNGVVLEDSVDDEIVLFLSEQPVELPCEITLFDRQGAVVGRHTAFDIGDRRT